jgi:4-hydroxybenzoyl-CoA thioesterase
MAGWVLYRSAAGILVLFRGLWQTNYKKGSERVCTRLGVCAHKGQGAHKDGFLITNPLLGLRVLCGSRILATVPGPTDRLPQRQHLNRSHFASGILSILDAMINRRKIHIEWGDCDPAQIVYYPRYLEYFDGCTAALFAKAGFSKREVLKAHGIVGFPLVEVSCRFMAPSYFSEDVVVESEIIKWGTSSFHVQHRLYKGKLLAVECLETRVWAARSATDAEKIQSKPLPREVIAKFGKSISKTQRRKRG